jgi:hypothetical protein
MKNRTLVSNQRYFGLDPLVFRRGAGRALARVAGVPLASISMTPKTIATDFKLDPAAVDALVEILLDRGLLQRGPQGDDYRLTDRFAEFALARVVPPLSRPAAKQLLDQASRFAATINAEWTDNPLVIHLMAVSGSYMSRTNRIGELTLWPLVRRRTVVRPRGFGAGMSTDDGIKEIGKALCALSSFIVVHVVTDKTSIERPFAVPFRDYFDAVRASSSPASFWGWKFLRQRAAAAR